MNCKICEHITQPLFVTKVLNKYQVQYVQCSQCGFIQTENVFWMEDAYSNAIDDLDVGYITRNISLSEIASNVIKRIIKKKQSLFLDYGGGYGMFVRLMRDKGFDFYRYDSFCENIFARPFDLSVLERTSKFDLVTSFEVFEHLDNPIKEIERMFDFSENILFSTVLVPEKKINEVSDWWYFVPETGQHISFYTLKSLQFIAERFNMNFFTDGKYLHLFTDKKYLVNPLKYISYKHQLIDKLLSRHFNYPHSLIHKDVEFILNKISIPD